MMRQATIHRTMVCLPLAILLVANMSPAATIAHSEKATFVPPDASSIELEYRDVAVMGRRSGTVIAPDDPDRQELLQYLPAIFLGYARHFLKPEFLPPQSYVEENLVLSRGVDVANLGDFRKADMAYLAYCVDGRDILISESFAGLQSRIGISLSLTEEEKLAGYQDENVVNVVKAIKDEYFVSDERAPFDIETEGSRQIDAHLLSARVTDGKVENYRQALKGTYASTGACLTFSKQPFYPSGYDPGVPVWDPPPDKYFDWLLGRYHAPRPEHGKNRE